MVSTPSPTKPNPTLIKPRRIHALLHLAIIHKPSFQTGKSSAQTQAAFLWLLRCLFTHPALQCHPTTTEHAFDAAAYFSDDLPDDLRAHLAKLDAARPTPDPRSAFVFGSQPALDGWLGLVTLSAGTTANPSAGTTAAAAASNATSTSLQSQAQSQSQYHTPAQRPPSPMLRSLSQQGQQKLLLQQQAQQKASGGGGGGATSGTGGAHQQQQPPQLQRFATTQGQSPQPGSVSVQQMQQLAAQRSASASPMQGQSQNLSQSQSQGQGTLGRVEKVEVRPMPFLLRRWEILPDPASNAGGNDTALSLGLFEARRV